MNLLFNIQSSISNFLIKEYPDKAFGIGDVLISANKTQNKGDYTVLLFPIAKKAGISPLQLGERIISYLQIEFNTLTFEIVSGFLNIEMPVSYWHDCLKHLMILDLKNLFAKKDKTVLVEYSSPNTNKPLHLGHIRNILLGWSLSNILDRLGYKVIKTQVVNDRGIAICKSMLAWQKFGNESTPESAGIKGDHFVGDYYVLFERKFKEEYQEFQTSEMGQQIYR
ncbi:MAG: arginine--tRNA ligase, partial [Saprospiraceae bacterium]|nr:arginine--tRNA ligase [Saprospiraceae bacterium]